MNMPVYTLSVCLCGGVEILYIAVQRWIRVCEKENVQACAFCVRLRNRHFSIVFLPRVLACLSESLQHFLFSQLVLTEHVCPFRGIVFMLVQVV